MSLWKPQVELYIAQGLPHTHTRTRHAEHIIHVCLGLGTCRLHRFSCSLILLNISNWTGFKLLYTCNYFLNSLLYFLLEIFIIFFPVIYVRPTEGFSRHLVYSWKHFFIGIFRFFYVFLLISVNFTCGLLSLAYHFKLH